MLYAHVNNDKVTAFPKGKGTCPHCMKEVIAKCGEIRVHHWSHVVDYSCDPWRTGETEWHLEWKKSFGLAFAEIKIQKEDKYHIADIVTQRGTIIEFQNSPISINEIKERETFYEKMIWVVNGTRFYKNLLIGKKPFKREMIVPHNLYFSEDIVYGKIWFWDFQNARPDSSIMKKLVLYSLQFDSSINKVCIEGNMDTKWTDGFLKFIHEINDKLRLTPPLPNDELFFHWLYCVKVWKQAQKPVFLDFGMNGVFYLKKWLGTDFGIFKSIDKEKFVNYYSNNHE